ncbi:MAG: DMT family transporter [Muribaculaceae bacterium]|nr:DMT family transporter [Muribaculaceae bacterium]
MTSNRTTAGKKYLVLLAHLGALVTMGAWGTSFLSSKILMQDGGFTPVETFIYRFTAAYLLLLALTFRKLLSLTWRDELQFLICGICAGSLYFITENYALNYTTTGNVSLLASISPLFTTILMAVVFKIRIKTGEILGSIVAFAGVGCVVFSSGDSLEIHPKGDILALSAALCWAIYTIVVKRLIPHYSSLFITRKLFFYGVLTALPLLFLQHEPYHLHLLFDINQPQYLMNLGFLVIMCSVAAYLIWNEVMKILGSVTASNYLYLQPIVTMIAAYFVFGEKVYLLGYIGCALIIGGLVMADKLDLDKKLKK